MSVLPAGEVHIWSASLDVPDDHWRLLSEEERERAGRFRFPLHRARYIAGRGILRTLLGRYLSADPGGLVFEYGGKGKPRLPGDPVQFNMSHTHGLAVFALAQDKRLGVDVEHVRPIEFAGDIAKRFFAPAEVALLMSAPEAERNAVFFSLWTRKESYIKAIGEGLSMPLDEFDVTAGVAPWRIAEFVPHEGTKAAVCVDGADWELRVRKLPG